MKPSSILVVDDEPDITSLLDSLLTQEGYRVETASNGEEGIQHFRTATHINRDTFDAAHHSNSEMTLPRQCKWLLP
jgi:CheY-like chemotaxis protein